MTMRVSPRMRMRLWVWVRSRLWSRPRPRRGRRSRTMPMTAITLSNWPFSCGFTSVPRLLSLSPSLPSFSLPLLWLFARFLRFYRGEIGPIRAGRNDNRVFDGFDMTHRSQIVLQHVVHPHDSLSLIQFEHFARDLQDNFEARVEQFPPVQRRQRDLEGSGNAGNNAWLHGSEVNRSAGDGMGGIRNAQRQLLTTWIRKTNQTCHLECSRSVEPSANRIQACG